MEIAGTTGARVVGLDQSEPMVHQGRARATAFGLAGCIRFVLGDGERLPFPDEAFDAVTFTYLLRYVNDPEATLVELARVVRPGGAVANLEFHQPTRPVWRGLWRLYTRAVMPAVGRAVSPPWYEVGRFLGPSISEFYRRCSLDEQLGMWRVAGITDVRARVMSLGAGVVIWGTKTEREGDPRGQ